MGQVTLNVCCGGYVCDMVPVVSSSFYVIIFLLYSLCMFMLLFFIQGVTRSIDQQWSIGKEPNLSVLPSCMFRDFQWLSRCLKMENGK